MRRIIPATTAVLIALLLCADGCGNPETRRRDRLAGRFIEIVSDSLPAAHLEEIRTLLATFWTRADLGEVFDEDIEEIEGDLEKYADLGHIDGEQLLNLMARVGYYTYRKDPRYNLPERIVDHPTLNPDAALIVFSPDSATPYQMYYRVPSADSSADSTADSTKTKKPSKGELKLK
jgi:hypothetical protein